MQKYTFMVLMFIVLVLSHNTAYSSNLSISKLTRDKIKSVLGEGNIIYSNKINLRIDNDKINKSSGYVIEGAYVNIRFGFRRSLKNIETIGIFIDGNEEPIVATIIPDKAISKEPFYFSIRGKAENDCYGHYKLLIVIKENKKLLAKNLPFTTFISDCASQ